MIIFSLIISNLEATDDRYKKLWKDVETLEQKGLPKSALEKTDEIYKLAMSEKNEQQIVKTLIYKLKYECQLDEKGTELAIQKTQQNIEKSTGITKSFMYLLLAYEYKSYYSQNSWTINQRSTTNNFESEGGFEFWDKTKFQDVVIKNAFMALDESLKKEKIENYEVLINNAEFVPETFPTLYDFMAYFILENLFANENRYYYGNNSSDKLTDNQLLDDITAFTKMDLSKIDTLSYTQNAVLVYQKWLNWRSQNQNQKEALIATDLRRLKFVHKILVQSTKINSA